MITFNTRIGKTDKDIEYAAQLINSDDVVAFPTETVYGLGGNAYSEKAVSKIYAAKGRPSDNPLIVHIPSFENVSDVASVITDDAVKLFNAFSPGPITVILPKKQIIPDCVTAGFDTVGIRIPSHDMARKFLSYCKVPVAAPSANLSKRVSPTTAEAVAEDMFGRIPMILDGGACSVGIESTVITLAKEMPTILRPGAITPNMIIDVLGSCASTSKKVLGAAPAPGMKYTHYRTTCDFAVRKSGNEVYALASYYQSLGRATVILSRSSNMYKYAGFDVIDLGETDEEICSSVYEQMRKAEKRYDVIVCEKVEGGELCDSIMNRLEKADNTK